MNRIAVVELADHYKISQQSEFLLNTKYTCHHLILVRKNLSSSYISNFLNTDLDYLVFSSSYSLLFYLFINSKSYSKIYFQSLLDNSTLFDKCSLLLFLLLNRLETIACVRNPMAYIPSKYKLYRDSFSKKP